MRGGYEILNQRERDIFYLLSKLYSNLSIRVKEVKSLCEANEDEHEEYMEYFQSNELWFKIGNSNIEPTRAFIENVEEGN